MDRSAEESPAVMVAQAHIRAWSNHDWEKARSRLADEVHVTVTSTQVMMPSTDTIGVDKYMDGLTKFAGAVEPGSAEVTESIGDRKNALVRVNVKGPFGPNGSSATIAGARLYLLDEEDKIKAERVIFFALSG